MVAASDVITAGGEVETSRPPRGRLVEAVFWLAPAVVFFVLPDRRLFLAQIFVYALFALSLDLIVGYAGILSLGHAAFFGSGAYTAGLLARHGWPEPLTGLAAAAMVGGAVGYAVSFVVVSGTDLTRLMVTLGVGLLTFEMANQASSITGGVDGLGDMQPAHLLGVFSFGLDGRAAFLYSLAILGLAFWLTRRLVHSAFGLGVRGIRENSRRMPAIGVNVNRRLRAVFAVAAALAAVAGAVLAQTTRFVGIDTLGFQRSADLLIMLLIGGSGRLYGGLVGATVFLLAQDALSGISPEYWQFWLGAVLVLVVLAAPGGITGGLEHLERWLGSRWKKGSSWRAR